MKIKLDLTRLVEDGRLTQVEADRLRTLAAHDTGSPGVGSALIALALSAGAVTADEAWAAACVDEDWNLETWGRDEEAAQRLAGRRTEFDAAALVLECTA